MGGPEFMVLTRTAHMRYLKKNHVAEVACRLCEKPIQLRGGGSCRKQEPKTLPPQMFQEDIDRLEEASKQPSDRSEPSDPSVIRGS
jgi:hypothetical protein